MSQTPPPGWYPDPQAPGLNRYWDGMKWTEQTAPDGGGGASPMGGPVPPGPQGEKSQNWFLRHKVLSAVLAVVVIGMIAAAAGGGSESDGDKDEAPAVATDRKSAEDATDDTKPSKDAKPSKKAEPKKEKAPKPVVVEATKLIKDFEDNELAADAKYKGKTLLVGGVVDKIDTELFDDEKYILRIGGGTDFEFFTVNCNGMSTDELATLNKGDNVKVLGKFDDGGDLGVEMKDCTLA